MQAAYEAAHQRVVVALPGKVRRQTRGFEFGDQHLVVTMDQQVQVAAARRVLAQVHIADVERKDLVLRQARQVQAQVEGTADQFGELATYQFTGRYAQPVFDIFTGLEYPHVGFVQHQQETVGLDAARQLDRLLGAALEGLGERAVCNHL